MARRSFRTSSAVRTAGIAGLAVVVGFGVASRAAGRYLLSSQGLSRRPVADTGFPISREKFEATMRGITPLERESAVADIVSEAAFLNQRWSVIFHDAARVYVAPRLVQINNVTRSACQTAGSPATAELFFCPPDKTVYYDATFAAAIKKLSAEYAHTNGIYGLQAALAHEWGHAVHFMLGEMSQGSDFEDSLEETAADCFAGAMTKEGEMAGRLVPEDLKSARFALAIASDREGRFLGASVADGIHGLPEHRVRVFEDGYNEGASGCSVALRNGRVPEGHAAISVAAPPASGPPPSGNGRVIYNADFRSGQGWFEGKGQFCLLTIGSNSLELQAVNPDATCMEPVAKIPALSGAVKIGVIARADGGSLLRGYGIYFGQVSDNHLYYTMFVRDHGDFRLAMWDGAAHDLIPWTPLSEYHSGNGNAIEVVTDERNIWCFVNYHLVGSVAAPHPVRGKAGLYLTEFGMRVVFWNFEVRQLQ